jgi:hypothetical protein
MFAKCANAASAEAFEYHSGGSFFRFSRGNASLSLDGGATTELGNAHHVEHYWLCPRCAKIFTLVYIEGAGVVLKPLWTEEPVAEILKTFIQA